MSPGPREEDAPPKGVVLPLDVIAGPLQASQPRNTQEVPAPGVKQYSPERQRDLVRLVVTCGMLLMLAYLVVFATLESASSPAHWTQTKEMLQILLPALTGIFGTVIGFYFGTAAMGSSRKPTDE